MTIGEAEDEHVLVGPRQLVRRLSGPDRPRFSICTLVTRWEEYSNAARLFRRGGFDQNTTEYLVVDNSRGNAADAFIALNEFLQAAGGDYVIICHQDVELLAHGRPDLEERLAELDALDPAWALCGNAGSTQDHAPVVCISHPYKQVDRSGGPLPRRVMSLDENFIVVRRAANLAASRDLSGFHHYGADLCLIADVLGWSAYVIDFFLRHNSGGTVDEAYLRSRRAIASKYERAFRPRWVNMIMGYPFYVSGSRGRTLAVRATRALGQRLGLVRVPKADGAM